MPIVEGLQYRYALHELPPGRYAFTRWRWELWHGAGLVAAGWRLSRADAERALRTTASRFGHELFGLRPPDPARTSYPDGFRLGAVNRVDSGALSLLLVPRALEQASLVAA